MHLKSIDPTFLSAYNEEEETSMNVIGIDWDQLAWITNYLSAAYYSNEVGKYTAEHVIVDKLVGTLGQKHSQIEAVGHSLGAHLVGHLGRKTYELTGEKLARVTGKILVLFCQILPN